MTNFLSDRLREQIPLGKYTKWASALSAETAVALLWVVDDFGRRLNAPGSNAAIEVSAPTMDEERMRKALLSLVRLQAGDELEEPQAGGDSFPQPGPAFREGMLPALESPLADLDERQFWILLWQVGEYGIRANSDIRDAPRFPGAGDQEGHLQAAVRVLCAIERGEPLTLAEAQRQVLKA